MFSMLLVGEFQKEEKKVEKGKNYIKIIFLSTKEGTKFLSSNG